MRRRFLLLLLLPLLACAPTTLRAQPRAAPGVQRFQLPVEAAVDPLAPAATQSWRGIPGLPVAASALLPGSGQWIQGQRRWVPYVAVEVWSWLRYRQHRHEAEDLADRYRDLAWLVARRVSIGARRDSIFEYYEAMADDDVNASGLFDVAPDEPGIQPETQLGTFNGDLWELSRRLYFGSDDYSPGTVEYQRAVEYYRTYAIPDAYAWSWGVNVLEKQLFKNLIRQSDDAYRSGTRVLGLIVANHIASAVDALITARLQQVAPGNSRLETGFVPEGGTTRIETRIRVLF